MNVADAPIPAAALNRPAAIALFVGAAIVVLDISLTSTALPAIAVGLGVPAATTIWIINIYYLAVVAALLPLAALGEIYGHRRVFLGGLIVFALGSLASGLADSLPGLMAGRALLGLGSAAVSATTPALIRALYPPHRIARGFGLYAMVVSIALSFGPATTSAILSTADWPWLFFLSIPIACGAIVLAVRHLPATDRSARSFDVISALLCAGTFAFLLFALAGVAHLGWRPVAISLAVGLLLGVLLHRRETGRPAPILAMDLFGIPFFTLSAATSVCAFAVQGLVFVVLPFLFKFQMGFSQIEAGLLITPWPASLAVMTLIAAPLVERVSPGILGGIGMAILALGLALLATMPADVGVPQIVWRLLLCAVGFGFFQSPNMVALMSSAPLDRSGGAGGILAISRLLGQSLGAVLVAFCLWTWPERGIEATLWLGASFAVLGGVVSISRILPAIRR